MSNRDAGQWALTRKKRAQNRRPFSLLWRAGASFVGPNHLGEAVRLRSVLIGVVLSGAFAGAQVSSQSPENSSQSSAARSQKTQAEDSSRPTLRKRSAADSEVSHPPSGV